MALRDVMKGGTPYMGISKSARARIDRSESKRECALINALYLAALHGIHSGSMSLKKSVFVCEGKITLFSFPKNPALHEQWTQLVFSEQQRSFSSVFVDERFINQAQFDAGFAHGLILKDGAAPAMKDPGRDSELQMVSETASNVGFVGDWSKCSSLFSSTHLLELGCFRKLYLSFIIVIKLKTFWRHVILSVKTQKSFFCDLLFSTRKK